MMNIEALQKIYNNTSGTLNTIVHFSPTINELPLGVADEKDPRKKIERNDRKREKHKARKLAKSMQDKSAAPASWGK